MNQNDMDRYYWRTGQRWSADNRRVEKPGTRRIRGNRVLYLLYGALAIIAGLRLLLR